MKLTGYFIKHPVSAIILNCTIILIGILCFNHLNVREYPDIQFPTITVNTSYPNASSEVVETSVTNILEDQLAAVEGLTEIKSSSSPDHSRIAMKFVSNMSMDRALIAVKDAIGLAKAKLPEQAKESIVERNAKSQGPPFMAVCLESASMGFSELTHYTNLTLKNAFRSVKGVASVEVWGTQYTYKVTLDHQKMYSFGINADEIYEAIAKADSSLPAGKFQKVIPVTIKSELTTIEDFENILVKKSPIPIFLKSIANIELAEEDKKFRLKINGKPGLCIGLDKTSDDNPLEVSTLVHKQVAELKKTLPDSVQMEVSLDQAAFIRASLKNIESSIIEAMLFV